MVMVIVLMVVMVMVTCRCHSSTWAASGTEARLVRVEGALIYRHHYYCVLIREGSKKDPFSNILLLWLRTSRIDDDDNHHHHQYGENTGLLPLLLRVERRAEDVGGPGLWRVTNPGHHHCHHHGHDGHHQQDGHGGHDQQHGDNGHDEQDGHDGYDQQDGHDGHAHQWSKTWCQVVEAIWSGALSTHWGRSGWRRTCFVFSTILCWDICVNKYKYQFNSSSHWTVALETLLDKFIIFFIRILLSHIKGSVKSG